MAYPLAFRLRVIDAVLDGKSSIAEVSRVGGAAGAPGARDAADPGRLGTVQRARGLGDRGAADPARGGAARGGARGDAGACLSEDQAIDIAVHAHYEQIADPGAGEIIEPVEQGADGAYTVHVCDLNVECSCRPNEGWLVTVACDGTITADVLLGNCPFG